MTTHTHGSNAHIAHLTTRLGECNRLRERARRPIAALESLKDSLTDELTRAEDSRIRREKLELEFFELEFFHNA